MGQLQCWLSRGLEICGNHHLSLKLETMTSKSYFLISGALTTEHNELMGAISPNYEGDQEECRAIRIKEVKDAQRELDALYSAQVPTT